MRNLKIWNDTIVLSLTFIYFLALGSFSLFFLASQVSFQIIIQVFFVLVLVIVIGIKFNPGKILQKKKNLAIISLLLPLILFVYFLVFSTGGLGSPFLILTHFFSIGLAFLLSPLIASAFIASTVILVVVHLFQDPIAYAFLVNTPLAASLYFLAYFAMVPFAFILAKEYKVKDEWVNVLEKQIATSKNQEEELLKNITDCVFALNPKSELVYLNLPAINLFKYGKEILGQNFFKLFSFKDKDGRDLENYSLPFEQTLSSKTQSIVEDIQMQGKEKKFTRVDIKILPIISEANTLGLVLIIKDRSQKEEEKNKRQTTTSMALSRFISFLAQQKQVFYNIEKKSPSERQIENLIKQNEVLEILAQDFIYTLKIEAGEIGGLSSFVNIPELVDELLDEEKSNAEQQGVSLVSCGKENQEKSIQPKTLNIPASDEILSGKLILGNPSLVHDSLKRIIDLNLLLCKKNGEVRVEVKQEKELVKLQISSVSNANAIPKEWADDLFEKFYGRLGNLLELSQTSGLEGFIAKSLIDRMGGNVTVQSLDNPYVLIFNITFGLKPHLTS